MRETTMDTALNGSIRVKQHRAGYRFSIDAFLLAGFLRPEPMAVVLDLGTGCGIIPLILARRHDGLKIYAVEVQPDLALLARENALENGMGDRVKVLEMDMRQLKKNDIPLPVDLVVANPPFRRQNSGRINPDSQKAIARHEVKVTLAELVGTGSRLLDPGGRFATIYPVERLTDLLNSMRHRHLEPKWLRMVHSARNAEAKRVLVEGIKQGRPGLRVLSPLIVYREGGGYTSEVAEMFQEAPAVPDLAAD